MLFINKSIFPFVVNICTASTSERLGNYLRVPLVPAWLLRRRAGVPRSTPTAMMVPVLTAGTITTRDNGHRRGTHHLVWSDTRLAARPVDPRVFWPKPTDRAPCISARIYVLRHGRRHQST